MLRFSSIGLLLFCTGFANAQITIPQEARIQNRKDYGVCWWACAEIAGNVQGITPLQGLTQRVVADGLGFHEGATTQNIETWMKRLNIRILSNPTGYKNSGFIQQCLQKGFPVILSAHWPNNTQHAILITHVGQERVQFTDPDGISQTDYPVHYINPNGATQDLIRGWNQIVERWTGQAYAFDPAAQPLGVVRMPSPSHNPLREGRQMLVSNGQLLNIKEVPVPIPPPPPPPQPPVVHAPQPTGPVHIASNQDIDDGVNRPDDQLRYGCYAPDYKAQVKRKP